MEISEQRGGLAERTTRWIVIALLGHRATALPIALVGRADKIGSAANSYTVMAAFLVAMNLALLVATASGRLRRLFDSGAFATADSVLTVAVFLWSAVVLTPGEYLQTYRDTFTLYGMGTIGLVTTLHGVRAGIAMTASAPGLMYVMARLNHSPVHSSGAMELAARESWMIIGFIVPIVVKRLGRDSELLADAEGLRAGQAAERLRALAAIHDTILQILGQVARHSIETAYSWRARLASIYELTVMHTTGLDQVFSPPVADAFDLAAELRKLADEFRSRGLSIALDLHDPGDAIDPRSGPVLAGAVRETLNNVLRHARTDHATVTSRADDKGCQVIVEDEGVGFDPALHKHGFGLATSVHGRLAEVHGTAEIRSTPGCGTWVCLAIPCGNDSRRPLLIPISPTETTDEETLTRKTLTWFAIPVLAWRAMISPALAISAAAYVPAVPPLFWVMFALVLAADLTVLLARSAKRLPNLLGSKIVFACDLAVAAGLNIWASAKLPPGTVMDPGYEVFWGYAMGVVVLWTALRGLLTGALILAGAIGLQLTMMYVNHTPPNAHVIAPILSRQAWLLLSYFATWIIIWFIRNTAHLAVQEGLRAGRQIERVGELRDLYEDAQATLARIAALARSPSVNPGTQLRKIRGQALLQSSRIRQALRTNVTKSAGMFIDSLLAVTDVYRGLGLRVELIYAEFTAEPSQPCADLLLDAVHSALENALRHAKAERAVVCVTTSDAGTEVVVRDYGTVVELATTALLHRLQDQLSGVGGTATIESESGYGTRAELVTPTAAPA